MASSDGSEDAETGLQTPKAQIASASASSATRKARRYGFACSSCKARKVKCSGNRPICTGCRRSGETCSWPAQSSTEFRLREANARIRNLEASMRSPIRSSNEPQPDLETPDTDITNPGTARSHPLSHDGSRAAEANADTEGSLWFQVGLGEDGTVIYNGPTSRFHAGSLEETHLTGEHQDSDPKRAQVEVLQSQYALMDSVWLPLIAAKPAMNGTGIDTTLGMALLDIYWTWLHPLHSCVYRPILMMDLALGGPYCTDFLLLCILGLAARHLPEQVTAAAGVGRGDQFIARARELLLKEMTAMKPAIPTIQGLLILGGRQCAMGKSSEGWLYTGMAVRMMKDIGLHLDITKLSRLERWTPAEIETRKRLYNSAYIWDKTLSLALGRPPSLIRRPYPAQDILDKVDDQRSWKPVQATEVSENFVASPSWTTSAFCAFCRLHEATTDMMLLFSSTSRNEEFTTQMEELDSRICQWYHEIPSPLRIEDASMLDQSPPPHIVSLNLLYHALHILLRRPYLSSSDTTIKEKALEVCVRHSKKIHSIHSLSSTTFPHRLMTYQVSYCIYTAATVEAEELKRASTGIERENAAARLAAACRILQQEASHTPGSGRSLDTIRRLLSNGQPRVVDVGNNSDCRHNAVSNSSENSHQVEPRQTESLNPRMGGVQRGSMGRHITSTRNHPAAQNASQLSSAVDPEVDENAFFTEGGSWSNDVSYGGTNTGAGFQPDAFPWGVADHILGDSGMSFSGTSLVWPSGSHLDGF
ncbi:uncharacterized protein CCOS01_00116 [Colletotrichum costaricense]|uniref:Zn(2)-C6 fungal-type domain-containing protein n=1 Tax=Colletotrichum costaricense TaxID=1209916 RepID=A0AAJ0E5R6_9PEZI|nr:uncharacterized protein CCOS01_00116 [Colletotrichum costaricense]KAK1538802.1 hypothetical protein CCOS01_00116 [Colletotrichum costaricense]